MFKKSIIVILIFSMIFAMSFTSFAKEDESTEKIEYVSIINPEVGGSGKIISDNSLFISIFVIENAELVLDLVKIDTKTFNFEEEAAPLIPEKSLQDEISEEVVEAESLEVAEEVVEEKVLFNTDEEENFDEGNSEILEEEPEPLTKEEIFTGYQNAQETFDVSKIEYFDATSKVIGIPNMSDESAEDFDPTHELSEQEIVDLANVVETYEAYNNSIVGYNDWEAEYLKLFEQVIVSGVELKVDPVLPYFEYTVNDIEPGNYKLVVRLKDTDEIVKLLEFEIVTEEALAEEIIDQMFNSIDFFDGIIDSGEME